MKFKLVLTVITDDSVLPCVVGPRLERLAPMPMNRLYHERGGYFFNPETESELAQQCLEDFQRYDKDSTKKKKKRI